jgi:uncharacterized protein (TIGR02466 family)
MNYNQGQVVPIFPTSLMFNKFPRPFSTEELDCIWSYRNEVRENTGNITTNDMYVLNNTILKEIHYYCQKSLEDYFTKIYNPINHENVNLQMTQSWLNYTDKGQFHHKHYHHNSLVSGCIYINAKKENDIILFSKRNNPQNWQIQSKEDNALNSNDIYVPIETGDIILFPSNLTHSVPSTNHDYTRISIAFNSFPSGEIGFVDGRLKGINFVKLDTTNQKLFYGI